MKYVLGIDFGGGASKATLLREDGKIVATSGTEYETFTTADGGREQNPNDWVNATFINIKNVLEASGVDGNDVECFCFDAATHTAVLLDENFRIVRNSVYWTDTRSEKEKEYLKENFGKDIFEKFKHNVDTIWTLPELLFLKNTEPENYSKIKKITFAKDYVRHVFTGDFVTDYIEAEGSMFFDFDKKCWDKKYLDVLGLDESYLPKVVNPEAFVGTIKSDVAKKLGINKNAKVICGTTDTAMEVFAAGAIKKGQTTIKLATAGRICVVSDKIVPDDNIINYSHIVDGLSYPGTATKSCAQSLRWFRDTFGGDYAEMDEKAKTVPTGCDGLMFHPYLNGELTPYGNPKLKASFIGISGTHKRAHFIRAVMEGVAMSMLDCKKYLEAKGITMTSAFIIGGGAKSKVWPQILCDALNIELIKTENNDSSFGSAMLAGIASGFFKDKKDALDRCSKITGKVVPDMDNNKKYEKLFIKYKTVQKALAEIYGA